MQKILLLALLWLMPAQAFHYAARVRGLQLLLQPNHAPAAININRSLLTRHAVSTRALQASRYAQPTTQSISWFSKLRNAWNTFFKRPNQPKAPRQNSYKNIIKSSAAFSIGTGIGLYNLCNTEICHAAETCPFTTDDLKDPVKLHSVIYSTPHSERPAFAARIIRYLASYLDGFMWESLLSNRITAHNASALIIVEFLTQYPIEIAQQAPECVAVVHFLIQHDKTLSEPIKNCVIRNKSALKNTLYGPKIIALIEQYSASQATTANDRIIHS